MTTTRKSKSDAPRSSAKTAAKTTANKKSTARKKPQASVRAGKAAAAKPTTSKKTKKAAAAVVLPPAHDEISARAWKLFEESGYQHGRDEEHWLRAEQELIAEAARNAAAETQIRP